jgi:hypothetical protein
MANLKHTKKVTETYSGTIDRLEWDFSNGVLTISGYGEIPDYDDSPGKKGHTGKARSPWYSFQKDVIKIVFKGYATKSKLDTFSGCENLKSISFEDEHGVLGVLDMAMQGYTVGTLWNIDSWFCEQIPHMLQDFRRKTIGYPGFMTSEEWDSILDRMAFCFTEMGKDQYEVFDDEKTEKESVAYREAMKDEGFALFSKYFWHLWW